MHGLESKSSHFLLFNDHIRILSIGLELACNAGSCWGISFKRDNFNLHLKRLPRISLSCMLVPVKYREYGVSQTNLWPNLGTLGTSQIQRSCTCRGAAVKCFQLCLVSLIFTVRAKQLGSLWYQLQGLEAFALN